MFRVMKNKWNVMCCQNHNWWVMNRHTNKIKLNAEIISKNVQNIYLWIIPLTVNTVQQCLDSELSLGCTLETEIDGNALTFEWQLNISKITNVVKFYFSHHGDRGSRPTHDGDDLQGIVRQWWPCILCHNWSLPRVYNSQNEYQVILFYMYLHSQFYCFLSFN